MKTLLSISPARSSLLLLFLAALISAAASTSLRRRSQFRALFRRKILLHWLLLHADIGGESKFYTHAKPAVDDDTTTDRAGESASELVGR